MFDGGIESAAPDRDANGSERTLDPAEGALADSSATTDLED